MSESAADGEPGVVSRDAVGEDQCCDEPNAKGGEPAADNIDTGQSSARSRDTRHLFQEPGGVAVRKMVQGQRTGHGICRPASQRKLQSIGLYVNNSCRGGGGLFGEAEGIALKIESQDGERLILRLGQLEHPAIVITVPGAEIDENALFGIARGRKRGEHLLCNCQSTEIPVQRRKIP